MPVFWKSYHVEEIEAYLAGIQGLPKLDPLEAPEIFNRALAGDQDAIARVVEAHLETVVHIAFKYCGYGLPLADLVSEGNLGLLRAAELYDPSHGIAFSTYSSVWIKQRMHRAITAQAHAVRIPVWRSQRLRKFDRLHQELSAELGREAEHVDVGDQLGISEENLDKLVGDRIHVESLDSESGANWFASKPDESIALPSDRLTQKELLDEITACLDGLDDTELQIISLKFGLLDDEPASYREMAPRFGKSREWIRRVGEGAMAKIRASVHAVANLPRVLITQRVNKTRSRLRNLPKLQSGNPAKLSVLNMALIHWLEPMFAIL